jgi:hypothetical protein
MASEPQAPFTATVHGGFAEDGVWVIDARLKFHGRVPAVGEDLLGEARLELLKGIIREGLRGRRLGAAQARVTLDAPVSGTDLGLDQEITRST